MISAEELRELLAKNVAAMRANQQATQDSLRAMMAAVSAIAGNVGVVSGAAAPVLTPAEMPS